MKKIKALFLDRDGVINIDYGYVYKKENFIFSEGIFKLLKLFSDNNYLLFIVTNQSGIGRGYYTEEDFNTLTLSMLASFKQNNIDIEDVYHCPHTPEDSCQCRKPNTGMIDTILKKYKIDLQHSWLIGDKQSDIKLALKSNIQNTIGITSLELDNTTHTFDSILSCYKFFKKNALIYK